MQVRYVTMANCTISVDCCVPGRPVRRKRETTSRCVFHYGVLWHAVVVSCLLIAGCNSESPQDSRPQDSGSSAYGPEGLPTTVPPPSREQYAQIIGLSSEDAPNDVLLHWLGDGPSPSQPVPIPARVIEELQSTAESFDCTPYIIDGGLKQAVIEAPRLRWLLAGRGVTSQDLAWICRLRHLRGLSLRGADLRGADLGLLEKLEDLQWLCLRGADLRSPVSRLPRVPELEVLDLKFSTVTDADMPSCGQFPKLKVLSICGTAVTDDGLKRVVEANPSLRYLKLSRAKHITEKAFPELIKLKQLEYIHVGSTPLEHFLFADDFRALIELQRELPLCYIGTGT